MPANHEKINNNIPCLWFVMLGALLRLIFAEDSYDMIYGNTTSHPQVWKAFFQLFQPFPTCLGVSLLWAAVHVLLQVVKLYTNKREAVVDNGLQGLRVLVTDK